MGGSADDSTTAPSAGGLGQGSREARVGAAVLAASEVLAVTDAAVLLEATENNGSPASAAGRGIAPNREPAEGPTHQVGEQTKLLIRGPIPTTSIHPAQATSLRPLGVANCLHPLLVRAPVAARSVGPWRRTTTATGPPAGPELYWSACWTCTFSYATTANGPSAGPEH